MPQMTIWPQGHQIGNKPPKQIKDVKGLKISLSSLKHGLNKDKVEGSKGPKLLNLIEVNILLFILKNVSRCLLEGKKPARDERRGSVRVPSFLA